MKKLLLILAYLISVNLLHSEEKINLSIAQKEGGKYGKYISFEITNSIGKYYSIDFFPREEINDHYIKNVSYSKYENKKWNFDVILIFVPNKANFLVNLYLIPKISQNEDLDAFLYKNLYLKKVFAENEKLNSNILSYFKKNSKIIFLNNGIILHPFDGLLRLDLPNILMNDPKSIIIELNKDIVEIRSKNHNLDYQAVLPYFDWVNSKIEIEKIIDFRTVNLEYILSVPEDVFSNSDFKNLDNNKIIEILTQIENIFDKLPNTKKLEVIKKYIKIQGYQILEKQRMDFLEKISESNELSDFSVLAKTRIEEYHKINKMMKENSIHK